jgi:hypothetical protein
MGRDNFLFSRGTTHVATQTYNLIDLSVSYNAANA